MRQKDEYNETVKELRGLAGQVVLGNTLAGLDEVCRKAANMIEELSEGQNNGRWIPVEEKLPDISVMGYGDAKMYSKDVLVALLWYDGDVTTETGWYNRSGTWSNDSKNCKVIAWQPLPPAYEPLKDRNSRGNDRRWEKDSLR